MREELKDNFSEIQEAFDVISDPVLIVDSDLNILRVNKITSDLLNMPNEKIVGNNCCTILSDNNLIGEQLKIAGEQDKAVSFETDGLNMPGYFNLHILTGFFSKSCLPGSLNDNFLITVR